ncbi:hypothetical protein C5167_039553 [Papaver somniferum]|uniref:Uncharacterized protein n=1 Tax=Papaver somniferum TaxID=3469 RepID=A0A4Y7ICF7_PAPSO|nr:hypothetical protein C5167_039553 [Papaver somniferum]
MMIRKGTEEARESAGVDEGTEGARESAGVDGLGFPESLALKEGISERFSTIPRQFLSVLQLFENKNGDYVLRADEDAGREGLLGAFGFLKGLQVCCSGIVGSVHHPAGSRFAGLQLSL